MSKLNDTMLARPPVYVRRSDLPEFWRIAAKARQTFPEAELFLEEFDRLQVAHETGVSDFVRLGSSVVYRDLRTKRQRRIRLVRPGAENGEENDVSLFSPIGGALVGLAAGAIFRWAGPDGKLRAIKVLKVTQGDAPS